jgi:hypothetical protein
MLEAGGLYGQQVLLTPPAAAEHQLHQGQQHVPQHRLKPGLAIKTHPKKPTQKNPPKKTQPKKPTEMFLLCVFFGFFKFLYFL